MRITPDISFTYPEMAVVRQTLYRSAMNNVPSGVAAALSGFTEWGKARSGDTVAIAVGSRGINQIDTVVYHCIRILREKGLKPFIIPAMGSHGGATEEGQKHILNKLGITESSMKAPIETDMDVRETGSLPCGLKIFIANKALDADHIVVINRIKPHTKFMADIESGLCKMLTIGLGKTRGAAEFHRQAVHHGFRIIENAADTVIKKCSVLFGLALTEDGYGNLSAIEAVPSESIIRREKEILKNVYGHMGRIPFDHVDILIVDFMGKDISGIGMDSKVTGRHRDITGDFYTSPHVKRIFVRDISPDSDGNGNGIGLADVTTTRLVRALDMEKTYINALTAISPEKAAIPIHFDTDRKAIEACAAMLGIDSLKNARIIRIKNTKSLELLQVSRAFAPDVDSSPDTRLVTPWSVMEFNRNGNLTEVLNP